MEQHYHHDSMTQTQQQAPLPESTVTHHDKTEESPTCTDTAKYLETVPCTTTTTTTTTTPAAGEEVVDILQTEDQAVTTSLSEQEQEQDQQQLGTAWTSMPPHKVEEQGGQGYDDQETPSTVKPDSKEISLLCDEHPGGIVDKKLVEEVNLESNGDTDNIDSLRDSDLLGSASTNTALLGNTNHESAQQSSLMSSTSSSHTNGDNEACEKYYAESNDSTKTKDLPPVTSNDADSNHGKQQQNNDNGEVEEVDGKHVQQSEDQTNTNVTSDDDKGNCEDQITNQSVDIVDGTSFENSINTPSPTNDLTNPVEIEPMISANQEQEQDTNIQPIVPATDNTITTTNSTESNPPTDRTLELSVHRDDEGQHINQQNQTVDNERTEGDDDNDDNIPLMSQYEGDRNNILPSVSTTTATTSLSISTGRNQLAHGATGDQTLTRVTTTGSDEQTLSEPPRPRHIWESDRQASECRRCNRRFSFLVRRHHCRRCGQIVCDRCSSHRVRLPVEELVEDPLISTSHYPIIALTPQRVCESCVRIPIKATDSNFGGTSRYSPQNNSSSNHMAEDSTTGLGHRPHPMNMQRTDSQQSLMTECPVCGTGLLGMRKGQQENHLNQCLSTGSPTVRPPRYIIYTLTEGTAQVGDECPICFEEFEVGNKIARMVCLCSYHRHCLRDWLERGKGCPIHYDSDIGTY